MSLISNKNKEHERKSKLIICLIVETRLGYLYMILLESATPDLPTNLCQFNIGCKPILSVN